MISKPPKVYESLSRSFCQKEGLLLIHTPSLDLSVSIAQAIYFSIDKLVILVDFTDSEIRQINYRLHHIKHQKILNKNDIRRDAPEVLSLVKTKKQTRMKNYLAGGIYQLTSQILLLDLLTQLYPQRISKIIIRHRSKIKDHFSTVPWISTLLKIGQSEASIVIASSKVTQYTGDNLQKMMRLFYVNKLVIWPFGRSQIHKQLKQQNIGQYCHKFTFTQQQKELHEHYKQLYRVCEEYKKNRTTEQQLNQLRYLICNIMNITKVQQLLELTVAISRSEQYELWKTNNATRMNIIQNIMKTTKAGVYTILKVPDEQKRYIDICALLQEKQVDKKEQGKEKEEQKPQGQKQEKQKPQQKQQQKPLQKQQTMMYQIQYRLALHQQYQDCIPVKLYKVIQGLKTQYQQIGQSKQEQSSVNVYLDCMHESTKKKLKRHIFNYNNKSQYSQFIRKLLLYLEIQRTQRLNLIRKLTNRIKNAQNKSKYKKYTQQFLQQQQAILLQELYHQVKSIFTLISAFENVQDIQQRDTLFHKQLHHIHTQYIHKESIHLTNTIFNDKDDVRLHHKFNIYISNISDLSLINQSLRILHPPICIFYDPNPIIVRHIYIANSELQFGIQQIRTLTFNDSLQVERINKAVVREDEAFWNITQNRKKLGQYHENPYSKIKKLIINDQVQRKAKMVNLTEAIDKNNSTRFIPDKYLEINIQRIIIVDKREFKSLLPSYLYHYGFKVCPLFLDSADYIISNHVAVEKKSVHTKDLHESLKSKRLADQLSKMSKKFTKPYLLIECQQIEDFKRQNFSYSANSFFGSKFGLNIRRELLQLINRFPKLIILWSTSLLHTIQIMIELKRNQPEPQVNKFRPVSDAHQEQDNILQSEADS